MNAQRKMMGNKPLSAEEYMEKHPNGDTAGYFKAQPKQEEAATATVELETENKADADAAALSVDSDMHVNIRITFCYNQKSWSHNIKVEKGSTAFAVKEAMI